jgi:hypothetical protein
LCAAQKTTFTFGLYCIFSRPAEQNPKYSILGSQPRARIFSFEHAQLLAQGTDLETEVVAGTEEAAEAGEKPKGKSHHGTGFIA